MDNESILEVLDTERFFLLDVHSDCRHDLAQAVLVHYSNFEAFKGFSLFEQLKNVVFDLDVLTKGETRLLELFDIWRLHKQEVFHCLPFFSTLDSQFIQVHFHSTLESLPELGTFGGYSLSDAVTSARAILIS